jgi:glucokinase
MKKPSSEVFAGRIVHTKDRFRKGDYQGFVLGGDIGGTHMSFSIAGLKKGKPEPLVSTHFLTQGTQSLIEAVRQTLRYADHLGINAGRACFGVAGPISPRRDSSIITNLKMNISVEEILKETGLKSLFLINDYEATGYGVNMLDVKNKKDIISIRDKKPVATKSFRPSKAVIGAGTGLGKSILVYRDMHDTYIPIPTEGGWSDFPAQGEREMEIMKFLKKYQGIEGNVACDDVVSGRGIESIFMFLKSTGEFRETKYTEDILNSLDKPPLIGRHRERDRMCRETFRLFARFYARCARNFVLESLARGGLYIAGGIAPKNPDIFRTKDFIKEFENSMKMEKILKEIPIYLIVNYDVSLYGACFAAAEIKDIG